MPSGPAHESGPGPGARRVRASTVAPDARRRPWGRRISSASLQRRARQAPSSPATHHPAPGGRNRHRCGRRTVVAGACVRSCPAGRGAAADPPPGAMRTARPTRILPWRAGRPHGRRLRTRSSCRRCRGPVPRAAVSAYPRRMRQPPAGRSELRAPRWTSPIAADRPAEFDAASPSVRRALHCRSPAARRLKAPMNHSTGGLP